MSTTTPTNSSTLAPITRVCALLKSVKKRCQYSGVRFSLSCYFKTKGYLCLKAIGVDDVYKSSLLLLLLLSLWGVGKERVLVVEKDMRAHLAHKIDLFLLHDGWMGFTFFNKKRTCVAVVCVFSFFAVLTVVGYFTCFYCTIMAGGESGFVWVFLLKLSWWWHW